MLLVLTASFLLIYAFLISYYFYHWLHIKRFPASEPSVFVSVVVAARNEEENIAFLLQSLQNQTYPAALFEVIIVDDFSTDRTEQIVRSFSWVRLIKPFGQPEDSSKKRAIEAGINEAGGELVLITDADCLPPKNWIQNMAAFQKKTGSVFIAAPVKFKTYASLLSVFQTLDFITLQGITAASVQANFHSMCNGANLGYLRSAFFEVGGFSGIDKLASGDDMLLMYKIWKKHPKKVHYLKDSEAIVETEPMKTWADFFQQRIRWSSKATHYQDRRVMLVLLFVYLFNCLFFVLLLSALFSSFNWWLLFYYLVGKTLIEMPFVYSVARFYKEQGLLKYFPFLQPLHIIYTVGIGLVSQFGKYDWKGRKTK